MTNEQKFYRFLSKTNWYFDEMIDDLYKSREQIENLRKIFKDAFNLSLFDHEIIDFVDFFSDEFDLNLEKSIENLKKIKKDTLTIYMDKWIAKKKRQVDDERVKVPKDVF